MIRKYFYLPGLLGALVALGRTLFLQHWDLTAVALAAAGGVIMLAGLLFNWKEVREWFSDPRGVFAVNTGVSVVVLVAILLVVNTLAFMRPLSADLTMAGRNTLTPGTRAFLQRLTRDISLRQFSGATPEMRGRQLLRSFAAESAHVRIGFVDVDKAPAEAKKYSVIKPGTIVASLDEKYRKVETPTEPALVTALLQVLATDRKTVCFATGHGEASITDESTGGYSRLAKLLEVSNFGVERITLLEPEVPAICNAVVIAGARQEISADEAKRLFLYARTGGRVAFLVDPPPAASFGQWLAPWGIITRSTGTIVDESGAGQTVGGTAEMPLAFAYGDHTITRGFNVSTMYDRARPLGTGPSELGGEPQALAETGKRAYLRPSGDARAMSKRGDEQAGPFALAAATSAGVPAAATRRTDQTRIVVFGDSDFASNALLQRQGNRDLILRTMSWLTGEDEGKVVNVGERQNRRIELTGRTAAWMLLVTVVLLPLVPGVVGVVVFIRGRR